MASFEYTITELWLHADRGLLVSNEKLPQC